jgi:hypothetical protein
MVVDASDRVDASACATQCPRHWAPHVTAAILQQDSDAPFGLCSVALTIFQVIPGICACLVAKVTVPLMSHCDTFWSDHMDTLISLTSVAQRNRVKAQPKQQSALSSHAPIGNIPIPTIKHYNQTL